MPFTNADSLKEYLNTIKQQIRNRQAQKAAVAEIESHIAELKEVYQSYGLEEKEALEKALQQMGDPTEIGMQLDHVHRPKMNWPILLFAVGLLLLGGLMQYNIPRVNSSMTFSIFHQMAIPMIGFCVILTICFLDYSFIGKYPFIFWFGLLFVVLLYFASRGFITINGGHGYLRSLMLLFIPAYAGIIYRFHHQGLNGIFYCGLFYLVPAMFTVLVIPSIAMFFLLSLCCFIMLHIALFQNWFNCNLKHGFLLLWLPVAAILLFFILYSFFFNAPTTLLERLNIFLHPEQDPLGKGYQPYILNSFLSNAKLIGKTYLYSIGSVPLESAMTINESMPGISSDFILTWVIAQYGILAGGALCLVLVVFTVWLLYFSCQQANKLGYFLAVGCSIGIAMQVILYVLINLGFIPITSIDLPLISSSTASIFANSCLVGCILSVCRNKALRFCQYQSMEIEK